MQFFSKVFSAETRSRYSLNTACFNVEVSPMNPGSYLSTVDVAELGFLTIGLIYNRSSLVTREGNRETPIDEKRYSLMYIIDGEMTVSSDQGTMRLGKGQMTLVDNHISRQMFVYKDVHLLLVAMGIETLHRHLPQAESLLNVVLQDPSNDNDIPLFLPLLSLWDTLKEGGLDHFSTSIGEQLLDDISSAYSRQYTHESRSPHAIRMMNMIRRYAEKNLSDPALSPTSIAQEFNVSTRYIRSLFQGAEKLSHYIQRRRIEESARMLANPQHRATSIMDIALHCGFTNATHFARCFKAEFNETARQFRQRHIRLEQQPILPPPSDYDE